MRHFITSSSPSAPPQPLPPPTPNSFAQATACSALAILPSFTFSPTGGCLTTLLSQVPRYATCPITVSNPPNPPTSSALYLYHAPLGSKAKGYLTPCVWRRANDLRPERGSLWTSSGGSGRGTRDPPLVPVSIREPACFTSSIFFFSLCL